MKKFTAFLLTFILLLGLASCGNEKAPDSTTAEDNTGTAASEKNSNAGEPSLSTSKNGKKVLVVYFSATGSTRRVATTVANEIGADIFEIAPQDAYTSDDLSWTNPDSRVCREHDDEALRNVQLKTTEIDGWADYDTVLIGYPIWWGIAAWPVDTFVKANDFTGKTVIPFCTSASSGLGQSGEKLAEIAKGGDWQTGKRFSSGENDSSVKAWTNELGLK